MEKGKGVEGGGGRRADGETKREGHPIPRVWRRPLSHSAHTVACPHPHRLSVLPARPYQVILPCWECADFEAAVLHETGHLLGLGHLDNIPNNLRSDAADFNPSPSPSNVYQAMLASGGRLNASACSLESLWARVQEGVPPTATDLEIGAGGYAVRNSVRLPALPPRWHSMPPLALPP